MSAWPIALGSVKLIGEAGAREVKSLERSQVVCHWTGRGVSVMQVKYELWCARYPKSAGRMQVQRGTTGIGNSHAWPRVGCFHSLPAHGLIYIL